MIRNLVEINIELRQLNQKRRELLTERRRLIVERRPEAAETSEFWADPILSIIENHPGASRQLIWTELFNSDIRPRITNRVLTNSLTTLRRRGSIENQGTKKNPNWYIKASTPN